MIAVQCPNKVLLLDYFEGEKLRSYRYQDLPGESYPVLFESLLSTLDKAMPDRTTTYRKLFPKLLQSLKFSSTAELGHPSTTELVIRPPADCQFVHLALRDSLGSVIIDQKIWNLLSPRDQVGALFHLLMISEVVCQGKKVSSSIYIRALNSALLAKEFSTFGLARTIQMFQMAQLNSLRIQTVLIDLSKPTAVSTGGRLKFGTAIEGSPWSHKGKSVTLKADRVVFHENGTVKSLRFSGRLLVQLQSGQVSFVTPDRFSSTPYPQERSPELHFYSSGGVEKGIVVDPKVLRNSQLEIQLASGIGRYENLRNSHLFLFPSGEIQVATQIAGKVRVNGQWVMLGPNASVSYHTPTQLKELVVQQPVSLLVQNQSRLFDGYLSFYEDGRLNCGYPVRSEKFFNSSQIERTAPAGTQVCFDRSGWLVGS